MFIIFLIFNLIILFFSMKLFKNKFNPISIYVITWTSCVCIHECGLITYYEITRYTWNIILLFELVYVLTCLLGVRISKFQLKSNHKKRDFSDKKVFILKWIIILSAIAAISIIPHILMTIRTYGINILKNSSNIYFNSIEEDVQNIQGLNVAGLSAVAVTFAGIYMSEFGFNKVILLPLALVILDQLSNGSRGFLINCFVLFLTPTLINLGNKKNRTNIAKKKYSIKAKLVILLPIVVLLYMTVNRSINSKNTFIELPYASELFRSIFNNNKTIYSILYYFSGPIAGLNEYLKSIQYYNFGSNTFRLMYQILIKIGIIDINNLYSGLETFYTPVPCNVVSYIGSLVSEFNIFGALIATNISAFIFGFSYDKSVKNNSLFYKTITSVFFTLFTFSFFANYFGTSYMIFTLFLGSFIAYFIDNKNHKIV